MPYLDPNCLSLIYFVSEEKREDYSTFKMLAYAQAYDLSIYAELTFLLFG